MILSVTGHFDAAHKLVGYNGKCANLHGHRWEVIAKFEGHEINKLGMVVDFGDLKSMVNCVIDKFDHSYLNDSELIQGNPTAENIIMVIYSRICRQLNIFFPTSIDLVSVELFETPGCSVIYKGEKINVYK